MKILGIDLGSREVKIVLTEDCKIKKKLKISTMTFYRDYCKYEGRVIVDIKKLNIGKIDIGISTGYGRNNTDIKTFKAINEIKAHVYGVFSQTGLNDFTLLDIGGQDIKVVKVENGIITDIELNDKCAASCGRYLENMSTLLEIPLNELFKYHKEPVDINSTCAVFSESELIGKIAEGAKIESLYAGVNYSLYKRLKPILSKFKDRKLILSGGVAYNTALKEYLLNDYDEVINLKEPQFNGAIGCCYYGYKTLKNSIMEV